MSEPTVVVSISGYNFTTGQLQDFIDKIASLDGFGPNPEIQVTHQEDFYELTASTDFHKSS